MSAGLGLAWLGLGDTTSSDSSSSADVSVSTADSPGISSVLDSIGSVFTYIPRQIQAAVNGAENTVLLALGIIAVLLIVVVALIGFAPNVKHIIPHFV